MSIPSVETFETDITEEIKQKQGSVTDVLAAHSKEEIAPPDYPIIKLLIVIILLLTFGLIGVVFFFFVKKPASTVPLQQVQTKPTTEQASLMTILPKTGPRIEPYVTSVKRHADGYALTLSSYSFVYGNILNSEEQFAKELLVLFGITDVTDPVFKDVLFSNQDMRVAMVTKKVALPVVEASSTPIVASATSTSSLLIASTTKATSTKATTTKQVPPTPEQPVATTTASTTNQTASSTSPEVFYISYGFVGTSTLLISTTKEKFLELRSAILK
jgi:flagellar basal body-associated protein FliL